MLEEGMDYRTDPIIDLKRRIDEYTERYRDTLFEISRREFSNSLNDDERSLASSIREFSLGYAELDKSVRPDVFQGYRLTDRQTHILSSSLTNGESVLELFQKLFSASES